MDTQTIDTVVMPIDFFESQKNLYVSKNWEDLLDIDIPVEISLREKSLERKIITYTDLLPYADPDKSELDIIIQEKLGGILEIRKRLVDLGELFFILKNQYKEGFSFRNLNGPHHNYSYFFIPGDCGVVFSRLSSKGWENKRDDLSYPISLDFFNFEDAKSKFFRKMVTNDLENRHTFYLKY